LWVGASFEVASVEPLFQTKRSGTDFPYDLSADGQRFLIVSAADDASAAGITVTSTVLVAISGYGPTRADVLDGGELFGRSRPAKSR